MYARDITRRFEKTTNGGIVMKTPDKIWITTDLNGYYMSNHPPCGEEYLRKDALMEWAKAMKRICKAAEPIEKAYQTMIDKLNEM